jgi:enterochelin esterase-like enzyme
MTTLKVKAKQGEADSTYITVEQIVRTDFYTEGRAPDQAYAMVYMTDGNKYRVEGELARALETLLEGAQITPEP